MRTETDVILSLQRHVNRALPDLVEVLTEVENERLTRPFAVVSSAGDRAVGGKRDMPLRTLPVTVYVYVRGDDRAAARRAVEDVREGLDRAFVEGLGDEPGGRVPLWDHEGRPAAYSVAVTAQGGAWRLTLDGHESDPLPVGADLGQVADAADAVAAAALDLAGATGTRVEGAPRRGDYTLVFDGDLRGRPIAGLGATADALAPAGSVALVTQLVAATAEPWRSPRDYLAVEEFASGWRPDPTDPTLRTVTAGMRLTWGRASATTTRDTLSGVKFEQSPAST